jgi:cytochrome o ubiquinol oxidase subunit III
VTLATIDRAPTAIPIELARGCGGGPAPKRIVVAYGFWIFILSEMVMFSALFAAYAVLSGDTAGGPTGAELFNLRSVFIETMSLLFSSYTCGVGALSAEPRHATRFLIFGAFTFVLGAGFLFIESTEFARMVEMGAGPRVAAFCPPSSHWSACTASTSPAD